MGAARVRLDLPGPAPHSALCTCRDIWQFTACSGFRALSTLGTLNWLQCGLIAERILCEQSNPMAEKGTQFHVSFPPNAGSWGSRKVVLIWSVAYMILWQEEEKGFWEDVSWQYLPPKIQGLVLILKIPGQAFALKGPHLASIPGLRSLVFAALSLF